MIIAPAMIPDKRILRINQETGEEWECWFSKETVRQCAEWFLKSGFQKNISIDHNGNVLEGVTIVEQWVVQSSEVDKSALYGYKLPVGSYVVMMKVENDEAWELVKSGVVRGLSIEGSFIEKFASKVKLEEKHCCEHSTNVLMKCEERKSALDKIVSIEMASRKAKKQRSIIVSQERWRTVSDEDSKPCPICLDLEEWSKDWVAKGTLPEPRTEAVHPKGWKAPASSCRCFKEYRKAKIEI